MDPSSGWTQPQMDHGAESDACENYVGRREAAAHLCCRPLARWHRTLSQSREAGKRKLGIGWAFLKSGGGRRLRLFHFFDHRIRELRRAGFTANILRQLLAMPVDLLQRIADLQRGVELAQVPQHEQS